MATRWIYRNSDFAWMVQAAGDPALIHTQPSAYTEVEIAQNDCPDPRTTRGQATTPFIRAATAGEMAAYDQLEVDTAATTCPSPDILALIACVAECCNLSETDARARFTRHLRRINRKAKGL